MSEAQVMKPAVNSSRRGRVAKLDARRRPAAAAEPGAACWLGTTNQVLSGLPRRNRLTAPRAVAEDTEKTAVFLYSKVKERLPSARFELGTPLGLMLHYNVIFPRHRDLPRRGGVAQRQRKWDAKL
jgi:hypothetical protein